jgi:quercetin dioxygenase-like cupin family protein
MTDKPYIAYPKRTEKTGAPAELTPATLVSEPGKVSFGFMDFKPGDFRTLHHHDHWELIIVDGSSEGPGYVFFDGKWWKAEPGSGTFVPRGYHHAWSAGSKGFRMLWVYGGSREEAGRTYDNETPLKQGISPEEEKNASVWKS